MDAVANFDFYGYVTKNNEIYTLCQAPFLSMNIFVNLDNLMLDPFTVESILKLVRLCVWISISLHSSFHKVYNVDISVFIM